MQECSTDSKERRYSSIDTLLNSKDAILEIENYFLKKKAWEFKKNVKNTMPLSDLYALLLEEKNKKRKIE